MSGESAEPPPPAEAPAEAEPVPGLGGAAPMSVLLMKIQGFWPSRPVFLVLAWSVQ